LAKLCGSPSLVVALIMSSAFLGSRLNQGSSCVRACVRACCAEQAGVCAAIDLLDELVTEHELWVLPCRDPIGLSGYRHALHLGLVRKKRLWEESLFPTF
jgi:hypothetical protein